MVKNPFSEARREFQRLQKKMPREIGRIAENHFKEGFRKGGGETDASSNGWAQVKRKQKLGKRYEYRGFKRSDRTRGILIGSGSARLKRSISVVKATPDQIILATVGPEVNKYAKVHNEGLQAGRGSGFKMPKREFVGRSKQLDKKVLDKIDQIVAEAVKPRKDFPPITIAK